MSGHGHASNQHLQAQRWSVFWTKKEPAAIAPDSLGSSQILVTQAETLDEFTVTNDIGLAQVGKKVTTLTNLLQKTNI